MWHEQFVGCHVPMLATDNLLTRVQRSNYKGVIFSQHFLGTLQGHFEECSGHSGDTRKTSWGC